MIKAAFFDIDGTLVSFQTHSIPYSAKLALTLLRQKGVKVFIATGRPPKNIAFLKDCFDFEFDGYVLMNGQYCRIGENVIRQAPLPDIAIQSVIPYLEQEDIACDFVDLECVFINRANERARTLSTLLKFSDPTERLGDVNYALTHTIYQLSAFVTVDEQPALMEHLPGCRAARWHESFTDIIPENGGKTVGMDCVLSHFGIPLSECIAFGDGGNDLEMLSHAAIGVAMGNAMPETKAAADYITQDVDHDGILRALQALNIVG